MSGVSINQNILCLGAPCVVAKRKRIAMNRRNSPRVRGSERVLFVAWILVFKRTPAAKSAYQGRLDIPDTSHLSST
jgi:hypothetical protein